MGIHYTQIMLFYCTYKTLRHKKVNDKGLEIAKYSENIVIFGFENFNFVNPRQRNRR